MREAQRVFVDSGAWIALALRRDPLHPTARALWDTLQGAGTRLYTSIPVVLETFTFLERNAERDVAIAWKDSLASVPRLKVLACSNADVEAAWAWFRRPDLHKLSAVDATSFVLMTRHQIRAAFSFDHHFAAAGFRLLA
jgi:predicted nucleic acid-binding protein